jgi:hypothetical protein
VLGPTIPQANADIKSGMEWMNENLLLTYRDTYVIAYDHSLFTAVKQAFHFRSPNDPAAVNARIRRAALPYLGFALIAFAALYWFRLRKLPLMNQIVVLIVAEITLPYMSLEYTLVHLYFAWALFLLFLARDVTPGRVVLPFSAAVVALAAFAFLFSPTPRRYLKTSLAGQTQLCALVALGAVAVRFPMRTSMFGEIGAPAAAAPAPMT